MTTCTSCPQGNIIFGYQGVSGSCTVLVPISGTDDGALYVYMSTPSGSLSGSVIYGSGTDGLPHAIGAVPAEDGSGQYALKTDTELILSGNIIVSNVKIYSVDGTSGSLVYGKAAADGTVYVTSSLISPVWVTGSIGTVSSITSSCTAPVWTTLASGCYTASIDSVGDLHTYDSRTSGSILASSIFVSGSIVGTHAYLAAISGSTVNTTNAALAASSSIVANSLVVSGSIVGTHAYLSGISGSVAANTNAVLAVSGSTVKTTDAVLSTSGSVVANTNAVLALSSSTVNTTNAVLAASSSIVYNSALVSGSVVASTNAILASNALTSGSIVAFASESFNENILNMIYSMFPYQLGVDGGTFDNAAGGTVVSVYGTTAITGSTICPWVFNATDLTRHYVALNTVTTASFTVSPAIPSISASLVIRFNKAKQGYNSANDSYQVTTLNPEYNHATGPTQWVSESAGAMGLTTSSDIPMSTYSRFVLQFSRMVGVTCSLSATISSDAVPIANDFYPITEALYGSSLINGDCYLVQSEPMKASWIRVNYWKSTSSNGILLRYWLY